METTNDDRQILIPEAIRQTASEDGAVLLDIEQGICFSLNAVGLKIWELLKQHYTIDQIADVLSQDFRVAREQLIVDTREFVVALETKHLIRRPEQSLRRTSWLTRLLPFKWGKHYQLVN